MGEHDHMVFPPLKGKVVGLLIGEGDKDIIGESSGSFVKARREVEGFS